MRRVVLSDLDNLVLGTEGERLEAGGGDAACCR